MKEPVKHEKNEKGRWVITPEWKEWARQQKKPKRKEPTKKHVTAENHKLTWREIAYSPDTGKRIFFCSCMAATSQYYLGCGAVGIQQSRSGAIVEVIKPRFE